MNKQAVRLVGLLVVVVAILLVAAYALSQTGGASWFPAVVFVVTAALAAGFVAVTVSPARRPLVLLPGQGGVGVSNSPVVAGLLVALLGAFFLVPVSLAVAWASAGERPVTAAGPLVLLALTVIALVPVVVGLVRGRYRLGGLVLTPDEVVYESFVRRRTLLWDQVEAVVAHPTVARLELRASRTPDVTGPRPRAGEKPLAPPGRLEQLGVPTGMLRTDADDLRALLDFYRIHPRDRHELADGTALARGREGARR